MSERSKFCECCGRLHHDKKWTKEKAVRRFCAEAISVDPTEQIFSTNDRASALMLETINRMAGRLQREGESEEA